MLGGGLKVVDFGAPLRELVPLCQRTFGRNGRLNDELLAFLYKEKDQPVGGTN